MDTAVTKGVSITFLAVQNNGRTLSTMAFSQYVSGIKATLHPRIVAEKANAAHLEIVSVDYGSLTDTRRHLISCEGHTSQGLDTA